MDYNNENILIIETPEGIDFSLRLAGPVIRCLAWVIDLCCILAITKALSLITGFLSIFSSDLGSALGILFYFIVSIGYGIVMEYFWRGQTIGKRLFKLQVMDIQGLNLQLHQVIIRNLLRVVDGLPLLYAVGGIACLFTRHSQRLGDLAGNTIVVWTTGISEPDLDQVLPDKYNSFRDYPHLVGRLRQKVSPKEAGVAIKALIRREQFELAARVELFREIASWFKNIVEFPQEAVDGISDEQYIRNVVDVLFRADVYKT
ncbi:MAG: RDD family protein [Desulfobacteraceae bacterium]|jgi:uncharacterized RDD family membrane protein YckC